MSKPNMSASPPQSQYFDDDHQSLRSFHTLTVSADSRIILSLSNHWLTLVEPLAVRSYLEAYQTTQHP